MVSRSLSPRKASPLSSLQGTHTVVVCTKGQRPLLYRDIHNPDAYVAAVHRKNPAAICSIVIDEQKLLPLVLSTDCDVVRVDLGLGAQTSQNAVFAGHPQGRGGSKGRMYMKRVGGRVVLRRR